MNTTAAELFYTSTEWSQNVYAILNTYAAIPLQSQVNHSINGQSSSTPDASPSLALPTMHMS